MVPAGLELVVGARLDPHFGPMVVVGLGGILVELLRDSATALAPVGEDEARAMLRRLRGYNCWKASAACRRWTRTGWWTSSAAYRNWRPTSASR